MSAEKSDEYVNNIEKIAILEAENARLKTENAKIPKLEAKIAELQVRWVHEAVTNTIAESRMYHASMLTRSCRPVADWTA